MSADRRTTMGVQHMTVVPENFDPDPDPDAGAEDEGEDDAGVDAT